MIGPASMNGGKFVSKQRPINYIWLCLYFLALNIISFLLIACGSTTEPTLAGTVNPPEPTATLEPTFTPSPLRTDIPIPTPVDTPTQEPAPLPQAGVSGRIINQETNQPITEAQVSADTQTATTNADGRYTLTGLEPGQYVLFVTHPDYDPGLSSIFTLVEGQELKVDLALYTPDNSPYPEDPMLTNPLDPNGAPTQEDAERLARMQGLTGKVVSIEETTLTGDYLVNYKIGDDIRAAVAEINHEAWELTDKTDRKWWIVKVCGNLASQLPEQAPIATPVPKPLPPMAEVLIDDLVVRACASEDCTEVGTAPRGSQMEVFGCLTGGNWCEVSWPGGRGWCTGESLRQLAVMTVIPKTTPVLPTPAPTPTQEVTISAEGKIAFASDREGNNEIYVINPDGSGLARLTNHPGRDGAPAWSPDGQRIAFLTNRDGPDPQNCGRIGQPSCGWEIYVMNADGSSSTRLTNLGALVLSDLTWSPDGSRIAFSFSPGGLINIYAMNVDGSGLAQLTNAQLGADVGPAWSPGTEIAFYSLRDDGNQEIYVMDADGSNQTRLTYDSASDISPRWSPDGNQIAFVSGSRLNGNWDWDIYVMNADGSGRTRLTDGILGSDPTWSPDGKRIAFGRNMKIYVMNVDGSDLRYLTEGFSPAWSH